MKYCDMTPTALKRTDKLIFAFVNIPSCEWIKKEHLHPLHLFYCLSSTKKLNIYISTMLTKYDRKCSAGTRT